MTPSEPADRGRFGRVIVTVIVAVALCFGAVAAGTVWNAGVRADRERAAHRHQVQAVTTGRAEDPPVAVRQDAGPQSVAAAVWEYPDNVRRSGTVQVPPRTPKGQTVTIWVDDAGSPARPPGSTSERAMTSFAGGVSVASVVAALEAGAVVLVRRRIGPHRLAAWEREWEQVEPVWSGRLRRGSGPDDDDA
ncbi:hypothetical protein ABTX77_28925 [Streptomyces sp. NPDC097704]|uniref:Rv1733c family protein n=1 Tax=Streptomyces sp. NPDC097704 TaxID=3157101 RepID=UPI003317CDB4